MLAGILGPLGAAGSIPTLDPRLLSFEQWAKTTLIDHNAAVEVWLPWQDWASAQISRGVFNPRTPPDPYRYSEWREWALQIRALE